MAEIYSKRKNEYNIRQRLKVYEKLGGAKCNRCGFDDIRALQLDHVFGTGCFERKQFKSTVTLYVHILKLSDEEAQKFYQVLCANHNWIKRTEQKEDVWNRNSSMTRYLREKSCVQ